MAGAALVSLLLTAGAGTLASARAAEDPAVVETIRRAVEIAGIPPVFHAGEERFVASELLPALYEKRLFRPLWIEGKGLRPVAGDLLETVRTAAAEGLDPGDYHLRALERLHQQFAQAGGNARTGLLADLDILMTDALLLLGTHLLAGRVHPETFDPEWIAAPREAHLGEIVARALEAEDVGLALRELSPTSGGYARLKSSLAAARRMDAGGGWQEIPAGPALKTGAAGHRVAALAARLAASGDLPGPEEDEAAIFGPELDAAVRSFQSRHGLSPDGVVGSRTLEALNVPAAARVRQIELNLERWRWLPRDLGSRYVLVNIPSFSMWVVDRGEEVLSMAVIVGRPFRRTPVFSDVMRYLVLSPYWEIPTSIAVQDLLPQIRKNPGFLEAQGIRVLSGWGSGGTELPAESVDWTRAGPGRFPYRLRQDPGPANALGKVKFMFPNRFNVYLHDTPARSLFAGDERAFSSGCIRVERALDLAAWLLQDVPGWSRESIEAAVAGGKERTVALKTPIPVHLEYWTAWTGADGLTHYRKDLYGRDARLDEALKAARKKHGELAEGLIP